MTTIRGPLPESPRPDYPWQGNDLSQREVDMLRLAETGDRLDLDKGPFDPPAMQNWDPERTIRAAVLRQLLIGQQWPVDPKGVRLRGLRISGRLDLEAATLRCPLHLQDCYLDDPGPVILDYATVSSLTLMGCYLAGLAGDSLTVTKDLDLTGSTFTGPLRLMGASITGSLNCRGAQLTAANSAGYALIAYGMKVGGSVDLGGGFTAAGAIELTGADITHNLACRDGAQLNGANRDGNALLADATRVGNHVLLDNGFTAAGAIWLYDADIGGGLSLRGAELTAASPDGNALAARRMKAGSVSLNGWAADGAVQPFAAAGTIDLTDAEITGSLTCTGARLTAGPGGNALTAGRVKVGGDVSLDGVAADGGALRLAAANIAGLLNCRGARLAGADNAGNALVAYQIKVGDDVLLDGGVTAAGTIDLTDAGIGGDLNCTDAFLRDAGIPGDHKGCALYADGAKVGGDVNLGEKFGKFTATGAVRLSGADITGELICLNAFLIGADGKDNALYANEVKVGGNVDFTGIFAVGTVSLRSATVGGSLRLKPRKLAGSKYEIDRDKVALDAAGAKISQELEWEPQAQVFGHVILEYAAVGRLTDNWADAPVARSESGFWPPNGRLRLDGLTYTTIGGSHPVGVGQRLKWIRSQYSAPEEGTANFATQPYELLANVYQQAGQDTEARTVALARRRDLRRFGNLTWYRVALNWLLDKTIQYGYQTWRAILALAVVYVAAVVIFWTAQHHGNLIVPLMETASGHQPPPVTQCTKSYPCFYPAGYAIDTVIPLINVHQATYWGPNGDATWGHALVVFTWVGTALGWALATLAVAGYTGLVRNADAL